MLCAYSDDDAAGTNCREELSVAELLVPLPISLSVVVDVLGADAYSTAYFTELLFLRYCPAVPPDGSSPLSVTHSAE